MEAYGEIKRVAAEAATAAGRYIRGRQGSLIKISHKGSKNNLVTDVDKKSEEMIIGRIKKTFPDHSILAEESGGRAGREGYLWVIDPLDGTTNYAHTFPFFSVSIGILHRGAVKIGVVYDPTREELFMAEAGKGATLNGKRIKASRIKKVEDSLIATGFAYHPVARLKNLKYMGKVLEIAQAVRRAGSAALDLCYVACGRFDGFWEQGLSPWDTAAGQLMVREAGGKVTDLKGKDFDIYDRDVVAANDRIHPQLLKILNK